MITLVVPIYNMAQYLPRCVDSLLRQTCRDFEIVLVDDGSTDASGAMCDRYAADHPGHIRVIQSDILENNLTVWRSAQAPDLDLRDGYPVVIYLLHGF